jgi:Protein of unknown function (DUF1588)/Protein of unknown function (DUF1592)/Protein of unknown function (DUF1595)/Protein of unknown function (DUF1585)/Protein of unknown function (DUF1587)
VAKVEFMRQRVVRFGLMLGLACTGRVGGINGIDPTPTTPGDPSKACKASDEIRPSAMQRLTRAQFSSIVTQWLAPEVTFAAQLPGDVREGLFASNGSTAVTRDIAERYLFVAEAIADNVKARAKTLAPCATNEKPEDCAATFIAKTGRLAFRRTLSDGERARYLKLFVQEAQATDYAGGIAALIEAMLQSPRFLYRLEPIPVGADPDSQEPYTIDAAALASRLSFLVWNMGPDDSLLSVAEAGRLQGDEIGREIERLLKDSRSQNSTAVFADAWAGIEDLDTAASSPERLGTLPAEVLTQMRDETRSFVDSVLRQSASNGGTFRELMTSTQTTASGVLAEKVYGLSAGVAGELRQHAAGQRAGLLTQASVMFVRAHSDQTSPVLRGKWVQENLLCTGVEPPPANVLAKVGPPQPNQTTRERVLAHRENPGCASCHVKLDDVGFAFEKYDQYGAFRSTEAGKPIDDSGKMVETDFDGPVAGALELGAKLAGSADANRCFSKHWFRYAFGRQAEAPDACLVETMSQSTLASGGGYNALLRTIGSSAAFLRRRSP